MTTFVPFQPSATAPFAFQATLDGSVYNVVIWWGLFGRRWFIWITNPNANNATAAYQAIVGSPDNANNNLIAAYFKTSTLIYRASSGNFEITP